MPEFSFDKAAAGLALLATLGVGYLAITISHFDAQISSVRASLESAASRMDTAFTTIADIRGSTGKTEATVDYLKGKIDDVQSSLKGMRQDLDRIKEATHADAAPMVQPTVAVATLSRLLSKNGLKSGSDYIVTAFGESEPWLCGLKAATEPKLRVVAASVHMKTQETGVIGAGGPCFTGTKQTHEAVVRLLSDAPTPNQNRR